MLSYTTEATYPQLVIALNNPGAVDTVYLTTDANVNHLTLTLATTAASAQFSPGQLVPPEQAPDGTGSLLYLDLSALNIPAADFARLVCAAPGWQTKLFADSIVGLTPEQVVLLTPGQSIEISIEGLVVPNPPGAPSVNLNLRYYRVPPCVEGTLPQVKFFKVVLQAPPSGHGRLYEAITCVVVGSNYVCNSAESYRPVSNQLSFALQPGPAPAQVPAGADTQFIVSFVYAEAAPGYGALSTPQQATQLTVRQGLNASGWSITPLLAAENPSWLLIPPAGAPLIGAGTEAVVEFMLDDIVTSFAPGPTLLYVQYRNIPSYNDGAYTLFINKIAHVAIQELAVAPSPAVLGLTGQAQVRVSWTASDAGTMLLYPGPQDVTNLDYYDTVINGATDFVLLAEGRYMASQGNVAQRPVHVDTLPFGNHGLYIRRHLGDSPPTPSGGWPDSPDIISAGAMPLVNTSQLTTSAAYNQGTPNSLPANPQDFNFVYLRALNPYATPLASTVFLYYVEKSLLMWPQNWRPASYAGAADTSTNAVRLEAPANGLVATQLPLAWIPPAQGKAYVLLTWVQSGPDQGTPPNLADIQSGLGIDEFLAKYANVSWREVSMSSVAPPTISQCTAIAGPGVPTMLNIGLQCRNVPTDSFIAFCAPGPDEQNTVIFSKSPVLNRNYTPTYQVEWPANFNSAIYYRWYQGATPPPANMNLSPIVTWVAGIAATQSEEEPTAEPPGPLASVGDPPMNDWNTLFGNVAQQGERFNAALSPSDYYYAFLSKADFDETTKLWDILFEVVPREWADNAILPGGESLRLAAPDGPASLYHLPAVAEASLLKTLGLKSTDDLAEGSWYLLQLRKQDTGTLNGNLYDPDIDLGGKKLG